jgi:integrating conjugative element protein (TIGR03759 family)
MNNQLRTIILTFALAASHSVVAIEHASTQVKQTGQGGSVVEASRLPASELARARIWELSEVEWLRYQQLLKGIRGSVSPSAISPIEVLGIHARDEAERQRYAQIWARAMHEDVEHILAFQHAYDAAGKRLYPNEPLIDTDRLPGKAEAPNAFQSDDRLLFFARPDCPVCDLMLKKLLKRIDDVSGIDIYLTDIAPGDDAAVRDWASTHGIDPNWVRSRRITLNHEGGTLDRLTRGQGEVPYILRRRGEDLSKLHASDL